MNAQRRIDQSNLNLSIASTNDRGKTLTDFMSLMKERHRKADERLKSMSDLMQPGTLMLTRA